MNGFKCWDCEKEIKDVNLNDFDEETANRLPRTKNGFFLIICSECKDNEY